MRFEQNLVAIEKQKESERDIREPKESGLKTLNEAGQTKLYGQ